jgi:Cap4 dsDNA endonuclease
MASGALISNTPREQAGSQSFRAFDFQVHASMARILNAYLNGDGFIAYFDLFDDLIFLNEEDGRVAISFYQMKARAGSAWTANRLASRPATGDLPKSIIGKAYHNLHEFGDLVRKAAIVSNQHLQAKYPNGGKTSADAGEILLSALSAADHRVLVAALEADFPNGIDPRHAEVLVYERIPLDVQSFRQTLLGTVIEFAVTIGPEYAVTAKPLYNALLSEITRCTGTVANAKTLTELKKQKGLGRSDILALVERVQQRARTPAEWWSTVEAELVSAGWKTVRLRRLSLACLEYWRARERGAGHAVNLSQALAKLLEQQPDLLGESIVDSLFAYELACTVAEPQGEPYTRQAALLVEVVDSLG